MAAVVCLKDGKVAVGFDPTGELTGRVRRLAGRWRQYRNFNGNVWLFPIEATLDVAQEFGDAAWQVDFNAEVQRRTEAADTILEAVRTDDTPFVMESLKETQADGNGFYEHQHFGIRWLLGVGKAILADDMGLGKTRQCLVASRILYERDGLQTVVIAPARLIPNWRLEVKKVGHPCVAIHSWAKIPSRDPMDRPFTLLVDEAHFGQNMASKRTERFLALSALADHLYLLTGTPIKNGKPINLFPLLLAVGHPLSVNRRQYELKFCKAKQTTYGREVVEDGWISWTCKACGNRNKHRYVFRAKANACRECKRRFPNPKSIWDTGGAANLVELHRRIKPIMLRRLKTEVLDLPPKTRQLVQVEITPKMKKAFDLVYKEAEARYLGRVQAGTIKESGSALALMTRIRHAASLAKVETTLELARDIIEQGHRPVIFCAYKSSAKMIAKELGVPSYDGDYTATTDLVQQFQDEQAAAFVCTHQKGGLGITLTAGCYAILHDRDLTPGDNDQAEDRLNRIGQTKPVTALWIQAFDIDLVIDKLLAGKQGIIDTVMTGIESEENQGNGSAITAQMVLKALFKN